MRVLHVSERRACRAIGQVRSSYRYVPQPDLTSREFVYHLIS